MDNNYSDINKQESENRNNNNLSKLSEKEIKEKANKFKKRQIISSSIISGFCLLAFAILFCCIPLIYKNESISGITITLLIIISILVVCFPLLSLCFTLRKSDKELARFQLKIENKPYIFNRETYKNKSLDTDFNISKEIKILASGISTTNLLIDNVNKKFCIQKGYRFSKSYEFSELINYEIYENGISKVKGTAGKSLIGGAFFGLGGLIVGSSMGKSVNEKCNQLQLIIRLNDINNPQIVITYINNANFDKSDYFYKKMKENLQQVCSMLEFMMNAKPLEEIIQTSTIDNTKSNKEQLQELKEMLDEGLITQEEFNQKKKQILEL